jgi:hypothetical protein
MKSILRVITPATSSDLITLDRLKVRLRIESSDDDAWLAEAITSQSLGAADWCKRVFGSEDIEETFRGVLVHRDFVGEYGGGLQLARYPVSQIASIFEDGVELGTDEWELDPEPGQIYRLNASDHRRGWSALKIIVLYRAGYDLPDAAPAPLVDAVTMLVQEAVLSSGRDALVKSETVQGLGTTEYWVDNTPGKVVDGMPVSIANKLETFINRTVG